MDSLYSHWGHHQEDIADLPLNNGNKVSDSDRDILRTEIVRWLDMGLI